jgi:hypothetical protein
LLRFRLGATTDAAMPTGDSAAAAAAAGIIPGGGGVIMQGLNSAPGCGKRGCGRKGGSQKPGARGLLLARCARWMIWLEPWMESVSCSCQHCSCDGCSLSFHVPIEKFWWCTQP